MSPNVANSNLMRALPVFSVVFAVVYLLAVELNWAVVTYHPATGTWGLGVEAAKAPRQPAMYWYGWLLTSAFAAAAAGAVAAVMPREWADRLQLGRLWPGLVWAIPVICMLMVLFLLRGYFLR